MVSGCCCHTRGPGRASRFAVAVAAALAGCGKGEDAAKLDDKERTRLRQQALTWLRADLEAWGKLLESQPDKGRAGVRSDGSSLRAAGDKPHTVSAAPAGRQASGRALRVLRPGPGGGKKQPST